MASTVCTWWYEEPYLSNTISFSNKRASSYEPSKYMLLLETILIEISIFLHTQALGLEMNTSFIRPRIQPLNTIYNGTFIHMRCMCHCIKLCVQGSLCQFCDPVANLYGWVQYIRSTPIEALRVGGLVYDAGKTSYKTHSGHKNEVELNVVDIEEDMRGDGCADALLHHS